jgi:hypothetical protein
MDLTEISRQIEGWNDSRDFGMICFVHEEQVGAI